MRRLWRWILVAFLWRAAREDTPGEERGRIVADGPPSPRAELVVVALLGLAALSAIGFIVVYALDRIPDQTQYLGLALGGAFAFLAAALIVAAHHLVVTEELEDEYGRPDPEEAARLAQVVSESGSRLRRGRLLAAAAGVATAGRVMPSSFSLS